MKNRLVCFPLLALFSAGCALDASDAPEQQGPDAEPQVSITAVSLDTDGSTLVREILWSRAQLRAALRERIDLARAQGVIIDPAELGLTEEELTAPTAGQENVGEAAAAISVDTACAKTSLWITDNGSWGDATHMLCYAGTGFMNLPSSWSGSDAVEPRRPYGVWGGSLSANLSFVTSWCDAGCYFPIWPHHLQSPVADPAFLSDAWQFGVDQFLTPILPTAAQSNDVLAQSPEGTWVAQNVLDGNQQTAYSSNWSPSSTNVNNAWLYASMAAPTLVSQIVLGARIDPTTGQPNAFPANYKVYITSPDNKFWIQVGVYQTQPQAHDNWNVTIALPTALHTWGVSIVPDALGTDTNGNHYFQMGDISFR